MRAAPAEQGLVLVDGAVATMGLQVGENAQIEVGKAAQSQQEQLVTILMHKPLGYVSGQPESGHAPAVALLNARSRWRGDGSPMNFAPSQLKGIAPAGRLDLDSTGLLVLTQDGRVARQLIGENSGVSKEYLVRVSLRRGGREVVQDVASVFPAAQLAKLRHGLSLDGRELKPAIVDWDSPQVLRFVLVEGRKRQIRRMCNACGLKVLDLKRIRIGRVMLGALPPGKWRYLSPDEKF